MQNMLTSGQAMNSTEASNVNRAFFQKYDQNRWFWRTHLVWGREPEGGGGGHQRHHPSHEIITYKISLALKCELTHSTKAFS